MAKYARTSLVFVLVALVFFVGTVSAGVSPASHGTLNSFETRKLQTGATSPNPRVQTIQFASKLVGKTLP